MLVAAVVVLLVVRGAMHSPAELSAPAEAERAPGMDAESRPLPPKALLQTATRRQDPALGVAVQSPADAGPVSVEDRLHSFGKLVELGQGFTLAEALAKNAKDADEHVDRLCDQNRKLQAHSGIPPPSTGGTSDAAAFMAPLIDYEKPLDHPPGLLHLPSDVVARIQGYGADWPTRISSQDIAGRDFSWLEALGQYDSWSVLSAGRLRDFPVGNVFYEPIPNYTSLLILAKLRYALSFVTGDFLEASAEVRHLAELMRSQGLLISELSGLMLYRFDALARIAAAAAGLDVSTRPSIDVTDVEGWRNTDWASVYFTYPGVSRETLTRALGCMPAPCSALVEGMGMSRTLGAYGATDNRQLLSQLARDQGCETAVFDRLGAAQELSAAEVVATPDMLKFVSGEIPRLLDGAQ
jgi:hypothetical protein